MYGFDTPKPMSIPIGSDWRKKGETLTWRVIEVGTYKVALSGPGPCRGIMYLDKDKLEIGWSRA